MKAAIMLIFVFMLFILIVFTCTTLSPDETGEYLSIRLSLEVDKRDSAEFSGSPIKALVEVDEAVSFSELSWNTGMGKLLVPEKVFNQPATKFEVFFYWHNYPLRKNVVDNSYFDTIYVSMGGNLKFSNQVRVKVKNLPVVVDSILVGDTVFSGLDTQLRYSVKSTATTVPITIYSRDLDGKIPDVMITGNNQPVTQLVLNSLKYSYKNPSGYFQDTIVFLIYDHAGSSVSRSLIIKRYAPNKPPVIDSIFVNNKIILSKLSISQVAFSSFDTLRFRVYARDPEDIAFMSYIWKAGKSERLKTDISGTDRIFYICTTCKDSLLDTAIVIDTIKCSVFDVSGDSVVHRIQLVKGVVNTPPVFDTVRINDSLYKATDSIIIIPALPLATYRIRYKASDFEKSPVTATWTGDGVALLSTKSDTAATYTSPAVIDSDTVLISLFDKSPGHRLRILFIPGAPYLDSLEIGDTTLIGSKSIYSYTTRINDTFFITAHVNKKVSSNLLKYTWSATNMGLFNMNIDNRARIILPAAGIKDTIHIAIKDGTIGYTTRLIIEGK